MKTLILYSGHLGSTAKAAEMLSKMMDGVTVLDTAINPKVDFGEYNTIVFGTNVRMFRLNKRFVKYAKKFKKANSDAKTFAFIMGASTEKKEEYINRVIKILGNSTVAIFAGGELNSENAKGFAKHMIESVKAELISKNQQFPTINEAALANLAKII